MELGASVSAAEVIPLTLLTVEASFLLPGSPQHTPGERRRSRIAAQRFSWRRSGSQTSSPPVDQTGNSLEANLSTEVHTRRRRRSSLNGQEGLSRCYRR